MSLNMGIEKNIPYQFSEKITSLVVGKNILPFILDVPTCNKTENLQKISINGDNFYILFPTVVFEIKQLTLKIKNDFISINLGEFLTIYINGSKIFEIRNENLEFDNFEENGIYTYLFFKGKRNCFVLIKNSQLVFGDYYVEFNEKDGKRIFMNRCLDILNHGKVYSIEKEKTESYLIYLDNYSLDLKTEFVGALMLDCIKNGNYKYANQLLKQEMRLKDEKKLTDFFANFDDFISLDNNTYILINKSTIVGAYKFEIENCEILNIIPLMP